MAATLALTLHAVLWAHVVAATEVGQGAGSWFDELVGMQGSRLVRVAPGQAARWRLREQSTVMTVPENTFADTGAVLVTFESSLWELNSWRRPSLEFHDAVPMSRFRPNLVIRGGAPFQEDGWLGRTIQIGETAKFRVDGACSRCSMITIEQQTGRQDQLPPKQSLPALLRKHRPNQPKGQGIDQSPEFGLHLTPLNPSVISVNDPVRVI